MAIKKLVTVICFLLTSMSYSQLADFNFNAVAIDETCSGNGSLEMTVSNTTPGAEIIYNLFLAPDFINAIAETTLGSFGSLQAGEYRIVATQSFAGLTNSKQLDLEIQNLVLSLDYDLSFTTVTDCEITGTIIVNILTGNPSSYEIISGPHIRPQQPTNEFSGLPTGTYVIRVFDDCNNALSKTFTMFLQGNSLDIGVAAIPIIYDSCSSVEVVNLITPATGTDIKYPLTITYTIYPPDGSPNQVVTQNLLNGPTDSIDLINTLPLYGNEIYTADLTIVDSCGKEYTLVNTIDPNPIVELTLRNAPCAYNYLTLSVKGFRPPYIINFDEAPEEFVPTQFNSVYPGPSIDAVMDFGDYEHPVPFGIYKVSIIDSCGRTGSFVVEAEEQKLEPEVGAGGVKCGENLGILRVSIPDSRKIVSAIITAAPLSYTEPLPADITSFVDEEGVLYVDLPAGDYELKVMDDCGYEYTITESVPEFQMQGLSPLSLPNCDAGTGAIQISGGNGHLISALMIGAPLTYTQTLPYDITFNIDVETGNLYMSNLPAGEYTFKAVDVCGFELETSVTVVGYSSNIDGYVLTRNCGSFNLGVFDGDTSITDKKYWFQRYFSETNSWGHPYTGVVYTEGTLPNSSNAIALQNYDTVYNLFLLGDFRIIKVFASYNSGTGNTNCIDDYAQFTISEKLIINAAYSLDCNGGSGPSDIVLDVVGVAPFTYSIALPYVFDNGNNNTFTALSPGPYVFKVMDNCGNIENINVEVGNLLPLARANTPKSMLVCRNDTNQVGVFILSNQSLQILGNQNPNDYTVTYHLNQPDANSGNAPLEEAYTNISNPQTIYARVEHKTLRNCYATTSFPIFIGNNPMLSPALPAFVCVGTTRTLTADPGFDTYEWTTGETTQSIVVTEPGSYGVTVKNVYQDFTCNSSKEFVVTGSSVAAFVDINTQDWTSGNNTITVLVSGTGDYVYSLDDVNYQPQNTFANLLPGSYTVYVKDVNGCGTIKDAFSLLNYPNFFTPNGDGYNDTWNIKFASFEPNISINIFDRYGKFIIQLFADGPGWDGTYNGKLLPSTDYWFVVTREDGTVHKGHFALKR